MGAELDLTEEESASVFSTRKVRARLRADEGKPVTAFRATLSWGSERLKNLFDEGQAAGSLVRARAHLVDEVLREAWSRHLSEKSPGLALVAVGGYGREELLPHSDIDILLLHSGEALDQSRQALEQLTAFFWDIGLEIGQSVRTVEECHSEAERDITVITNLLESRHLAGDAGLFAEMEARLTPAQLWPMDQFFRAKKAEQASRYRKFDDTGYKLEPNVKESPGGLRDIHMIGWVARRHFGARTLGELREHGFLTKQECDDLFAGQDFLWRVRFALHMITGRREDRLLFDHQVRIAELFGYVNTDPAHSPNEAVEQFMQLYYRTIKSLSCLNDMLLQLFEEAILHPLADSAVRAINPRFQIRNGFMEVRDDSVFREHPTALIELFLLMQQNPGLEGIRAQTVRLLVRDSRLMDAEVRSDVRSRTLFIQMFREGRGLTRNLRRMNRYGVLGRYLPSFGKIVGLMQYDLFHTLTVDEHTLYVVRNLRRFAMERFRHEMPFCSELFGKLTKPELLYLAGFFHDMAKGRGGDHSDLGSHESQEFCLTHGFSHADADLVAWLVKNHLMMSLTAQRADITDPQVIAEFTRKVGDHFRLDYLFLLTVADIRATNPALWNSWRESLLLDLYRSTRRALQRGPENPMLQEELVAETQQTARELLLASGAATDTSTIWPRFGNEYFLRHSPEELAWHLPAIARCLEQDLPLVLVDNIVGRGTTVFVYMRDRDHLFALSTGLLARLGLTILDARIHTTADGFVLDSYVVMEGDGSPINSSHRLDEIGVELRRVLADPGMSVINVNRHVSQRLKHFNTPTIVHFSQDTARGRTILELVTADQPGLLSMIGRVFHKRGILLDGAKIGTIGERAEDVFFVTDHDHQPITDEAALDELREVLTRTLDKSEL